MLVNKMLVLSLVVSLSTVSSAIASETVVSQESLAGVQATCNICDLQSVMGPCKASLSRFYYDVDAGACKEFTYGGCEGNQNNFQTLKECKTTCGKQANSGDICKLPAVTGPCKAAISRYYYDADAGTCKEFTYGGCEGNQNNFQTSKECKTTCGK